MKLFELFDYLITGQKLIIRLPLNVFTEETFEVEIMRDQRYGSWRSEYEEWLRKLDLEVKTIFAGDSGNLLITCKPEILVPACVRDIILERAEKKDEVEQN